MAFDSSKLRTYCIGIVATDKPRGTDVISFYPVEGLSFEEGNPADNKEDVDIVISNAAGKSQKSKTERKSVLNARWFSDGSDGRQTAPDVINGETVRIYKYGDSEVFYWKTMFRECEIRRKEHVVFAYGNLASGRTPWDMDSSYGNMWSTHDKKIMFWTTTSDGEKFKYNFAIDTLNSYYEMKDDIGNSFGFLSQPHQIWLKNASGSMIQYEKGTGLLRASDGIRHETPVSHFTESGKFDKNLDILDHCAAGSMSTGGIVAGSYGFGGPLFSVGSVSPPSEINVPERGMRFSMRKAITRGFYHTEPVMFDIPESVFEGDVTVNGTVRAKHFYWDGYEEIYGMPPAANFGEDHPLIQNLLVRIKALEDEILELKNK